MISMIAGMDRQRLIGRDNQLPWRLPEDMQWFRQNTLGKTVLMGRKTYESIGKALPQRHNVILTTNKDFEAAGCTILGSIDEALAYAETCDELMVMGGSQIYQAFLPHAQRLYLTRIDEDFAGDAWFPAYEQYSWKKDVRLEAVSATSPYLAYRFIVLDRVPEQ